MKKILIDTNGYLRLLLDDIPQQANQVESLLQLAKKGEIEVFLPQIVVFELVFALEKYYRFSKEEVLNKIESLISMKYIHIEATQTFMKTIILYRRSRVSFVDCFLRTYSETHAADLFTFDKKLQKESR